MSTSGNNGRCLCHFVVIIAVLIDLVAQVFFLSFSFMHNAIVDERKKWRRGAELCFKKLPDKLVA